jgi:hypothetical protein
MIAGYVGQLYMMDRKYRAELTGEIQEVYMTDRK